MLSLDDFLDFAEKKLRFDELPIYMVFVIRVYATTVSGGLEIMCKVLVLYSEALEWAKTSFSTTSTWRENLDSIIANCSSTSNDIAVVCKCILEQLAPIIAQSNSILAEMPSIDLPDEIEDGVYGALRLGLERLSRISVEVEQQDLSWLKEFLEQEATNRL